MDIKRSSLQVEKKKVYFYRRMLDNIFKGMIDYKIVVF